MYENKSVVEEKTLSQKWEEATFANNFIFYKVMRHHPEACRQLIELLLGIKIERLEMHNEESIDLDHDSRGIRLDVGEQKNPSVDFFVRTRDSVHLKAKQIFSLSSCRILAAHALHGCRGKARTEFRSRNSVVVSKTGRFANEGTFLLYRHVLD